MKKMVCLGIIALSIVCLFIIKNFAFAMMCGTHGEGGHSGHAQAIEAGSSAQMAGEEVGNKICPVSGEKINEKGKATYEYKGKVYNFCCPGCIDEFKKDPEKYIKKMKEQKGGQGREQHQGHQNH